MFVIGGTATQNGVEQARTTKKSEGTSEKADVKTVKPGSSRGYFQRNRWWKEDFGGRKWGGGFGDDMQLRSIVLQYYRLYALHHVIPPPWGSHLSLPPKANKPAQNKLTQRYATIQIPCATGHFLQWS
jgi:hypothetical protein